jgi:hypothetical protein
MLLAGAVLLALTACGATHGSSTKPLSGPRRTLRIAYPEGVYAYGYHATVSGMQQQANGQKAPLNVDLSAQGRWQAGAQTSHGQTIAASFSNMKSKQGPAQSQTATTFTFTPTSIPSAPPFIALLPSHPVRPSATWTTHVVVPNQFGSGSLDYVAHSAFQQITSFGGASAAEVRTTATIPVDLTVNLAQAAQVTGKPSTLGAIPQAKYQGRETVTTTTLLGVSNHRIDRTDSVAQVDLTETPMGNGASGQRPASFSGREETTFNSLE